MEESDKPHEECGVFGVWGQRESAAPTIFFSLFSLQHRGQESAGIATLHHVMHLHRGMGLVSQVFTEEVMRGLKGSCGVGHTRYSTAGSSQVTNAQPFVVETDLGPMALAHNGQLTTAPSLRKRILKRGTALHTTSDTELITQMLATPLTSETPMRLSYDEDELREKVGEAAGDEVGEGGGKGEEDDKPSPPTSSSPLPPPSLPRRLREDVTMASGGPPTPRREILEAAPPRDTWEGRLARFVLDAKGAYSLALLTKDGLFGVRDRLGMRPLCIGRRLEAKHDGDESGGGGEGSGGGSGGGGSDGGGESGSDSNYLYFLSSESCALGTVGAELVREVLPGEIVRIDDEGVHSTMALPTIQKSIRPALCVFEFIYFARPDSVLNSRLVHSVRQRLGEELAKESGVLDADIVSGVPDSSTPAAIGFAAQSGIPYMEVFCKNRYIARTFIQPTDELRKSAIRLKFNVLAENVRGKKLVLLDDSIVRGNTLKKLVPLLLEAGAKEVHIRVTSPPLRHPCFMGVNIGTYKELIAHKAKVDAIRDHIGAHSLQFLSLEGVFNALNKEEHQGYCHACFSGQYPLPVEELDKEEW